jgi:hypothetical protein
MAGCVARAVEGGRQTLPNALGDAPQLIDDAFGAAVDGVGETGRTDLVGEAAEALCDLRGFAAMREVEHRAREEIGILGRTLQHSVQVVEGYPCGFVIPQNLGVLGDG